MFHHPISSLSFATASSPQSGGYLHRGRPVGADFLASLYQHPLLFAIALQIVTIMRSPRRRRLLALDVGVVLAMLLGPFQSHLAEIRTPPSASAAARTASVLYSQSPVGNSPATTRRVGDLTAKGRQVGDSHQVPNRANRSVSFEPNRGQTDPTVRFKGSGLGGGLFFTSSGVVAVVPAPRNLSDDRTSDADAATSFGTVGCPARADNNTDPDADWDETIGVERRTPRAARVVRMKFLDSNSSTNIEAGTTLPGKVNYLLGGDSSKWITNLPTLGSRIAISTQVSTSPMMGLRDN